MHFFLSIRNFVTSKTELMASELFQRRCLVSSIGVLETRRCHLSSQSPSILCPGHIFSNSISVMTRLIMLHVVRILNEPEGASSWNANSSWKNIVAIKEKFAPLKTILIAENHRWLVRNHRLFFKITTAGKDSILSKSYKSKLLQNSISYFQKVFTTRIDESGFWKDFQWNRLI